MSKIDPAEKRVRIGLTLAPDVAKILSEYGRSDATDWDVRPTRTRIIETAVREWATRQSARSTVINIRRCSHEAHAKYARCTGGHCAGACAG